jgi:hypothetical protein
LVADTPTQVISQAIGSGTKTASPATAANIIVTFGVERECAAANVTHHQAASSHVTEM